LRKIVLSKPPHIAILLHFKSFGELLELLEEDEEQSEPSKKRSHRSILTEKIRKGSTE
jgi:hypothetical protein